MIIVPNCRHGVKGRSQFLAAAGLLVEIGSGVSPEDARVDVNLVGGRRMAMLNRTYRGRRGAAEILTFPYGEGSSGSSGEEPVGEIFLCWTKLVEGARRRRVDATSYLARLLVHGLCHLGGLNHRDPENEANMEEVEQTLLAPHLPAAVIARLFA